MFLFDTNVVSELRRPDRADARVLAWAGARAMDEVFLSAITVLELERGVQRVARRDAAQGEVLARWLGGVLGRYEGRILPVDVAVARRCAGLHVPDPRSERDAVIAATALVHGLTLVTRNVRDFAKTGAVLLNPWDAAG